MTNIMEEFTANLTNHNLSESTLLTANAINFVGMTLGVASIILNIVFIVGMRLTQERSTAYFRFMWNLSISDILAACSFLLIQTWPTMFFAPISKKDDFVLVIVLPYVFRSWPWMFFTSYVLTLTGLTVNQYLAVCKPWRYSQLVTRTRVTYTLVGAWGMSSLQILIPLMVILMLYGINDRRTAMEALYSISSAEIKVWLAVFIFCNLLSFVLDVCIYRKLRIIKRKRRMNYIGADSLNIRNKQEAFMTVAILLVASLLCRLPFPLTGLISFELGSPVFDAGMVCLLYLNFFVDPIIYITRMREVRTVYSDLFKSCPFYPLRKKSQRCSLSQNNDLGDLTEAHNLLSSNPPTMV